MIAIAGAPAAHAGNVATDGSVGAKLTLPGPHRVVPASLGQQRGANLFHSFQSLDIDRGESVRFTGPADVRNILSRVTGGKASSVNGLLASDIEGANLFLINPSGIIFGEHARLEISGAFVATTADEVKFADGGKFSARTPGESVLTSAPPSAFGFLGPAASAIRLRGTADSPAKLTVPTGQGISLVAGDVDLARTQVRAPAGWVNITSVASAGDVMLDQDRAGLVTDLSGVAKFGTTILSHNTQIKADSDPDDITSSPGGTIAISTGTLSMRNSSIDSTTLLSLDAGAPITVTATEQVAIKRSRIQASTLLSGDSGNVTVNTGLLELLDGGVLGSLSAGFGDAGDVSITADRIVITGENADGASGVVAGSIFGPGNSGDITVRCRSLLVDGDAQIRAETNGTGAGGLIDVAADKIVLAGDGAGQIGGIVSSTGGVDPGSGDAGSVRIDTRSIRMERDGSVVVATTGAGNGGAVQIAADKIILNSDIPEAPAMITAASDSTTGGSGAGGVVTIDAKSLRMIGSSIITASTTTAGAGGNVNINADSLRVDSGLIAAATAGLAPAGNVAINSKTVRVETGGGISTSTQGDATAGSVSIAATNIDLPGGVVVTATAGGGAAGDVNIDATTLRLAGGLIFANSEAGGAAGNVSINSDTMRLSSGGRITAQSTGTGAAGNVTLVGNQIFIDSIDSGVGTLVTTVTTTTGGPAPAGDIFVNARRIELTNGSVLSAGSAGEGAGGSTHLEAADIVIAGARTEDDITIVGAAVTGAGDGGLVDIRADRLRVGGGAVVTAATGGAGNGGRLAINASQIDIDGGAAEKSSAILVGSIQQGTGNGGEANIVTDDLRVRRGGVIVASSETPGNGGDIRVAARRSVSISNGIVAASSDPRSNDFDVESSGNAGSVFISAPQIRTEDRSAVGAIASRSNGGTLSLSGQTIDVLDSTLGVQADKHGGSVVIHAGERFYAFRSQINAIGNEAIGSISIDPIFTILNQSSLLTDTRPGGGGNINITTDQFLRADTTITAAGIVQITVLNADTDVTAGLLQLRGDFLDEAARLKEACGQQVQGFSSFVVEGRGGVPAEPGMPLPAPTGEPTTRPEER